MAIIRRKTWPEVVVGNVYLDRDRRAKGRHVIVESIVDFEDGDSYALVRPINVSGPRTKVAVRNLQSFRFDLVESKQSKQRLSPATSVG